MSFLIPGICFRNSRRFVEVGVERRTSQRVQLHGLALDQFGLEGLDTEPVQGRCTVHQYRVAFDHVLEDIPRCV